MKKFLHKTNLFLRSLLFSTVVVGTSIPYSFLCTAAFILPLKYRIKLIFGWTDVMIWSLKKICGIDYQIEGLENIPKDRNGIIFSKHQSTWETFFLPGLFHGPAIILKRELLWMPFFGWGAATVEPISIDRNNKISAMEQIINQGTKSLKAGRWVLIFPEGTRMAVRHTGKYKIGGARLAVASGFPVLPVAHNAGHYWPRKKFIKKPGTVKVIIGPLIESKEKTPEQVLKEAKDWIESTMQKIE